MPFANIYLAKRRICFPTVNIGPKNANQVGRDVRNLQTRESE